MRIVLLALSFMSLGLGIIGIILPILPTTPFILLTIYLFSKSSQKYHDWIINLPIYKKHVQSFHEKKEMTFKQKWTLLITVDIMLLISFVRIDLLALRVLIVILFLFKHYYFNKYIKVT